MTGDGQVAGVGAREALLPTSRRAWVVSQFGRFRQTVRLASVIAIAWSLMQLYGAAAGRPHVMLFRPMHVAFAVALVFAAYPVMRRYSTVEQFAAGEGPGVLAPRVVRVLDVAMIALSLGLGGYFIHHSERITERVAHVAEVTTGDVIVGVAMLVLALEACRRVVGPSLTGLALVFIAYQTWGDALTGALRHQGVSLERFIDLQILTPQGLFGVPTGVSVEYVFYFILFAAFLEVSGGGKFFIDLAFAVTGRARGGPAKASIVASGMMGSINGSATANVVSTGVFTIPLMKRTGYPPAFAGAVEAASSTGGQILPPIMGAGAFIMAQTIGWPYRDVVLAAVLPAVLYFVAVYFMVDLKARKDGILAVPVHERPTLSNVVGRLHLLVPLMYLVYMILSGYSLMLSAFRAMMAVLIISFLRRATRVGPRKLVTALNSGARRAVTVALPCAVAGVIVGVITQTNLGLQFSQLVISLSGGNLGPALILVMFGSIILGLGMPTTSAYIMAAVLMAPALIDLGVPPIGAHLFVFYFGCMSMLTPPVALAAFAAAGVADAPLARTGWTAFRISLAAFLIPFAFVLSPALILQGPTTSTVWYFLTALMGTFSLACGVIGYGRGHARPWQRALFIGLALAMIVPEPISDVVGAVSVVTLLFVQAAVTRREATAEGATEGGDKDAEVATQATGQDRDRMP